MSATGAVDLDEARPRRAVTAPAALEIPAIVPALLIGLIAFIIVRGFAPLDPTNILWLDERDRAMHTLGWWWFAMAPWGWPPGASPLNGLELANGVGLSDSLPLFAFPFKLIAQWLPVRFQYWGYWELLCFVLQSLFAVLIAHELKLSRPMALIAAIFCVFQPAFLMRLDVHMALAGHWTILAAVWLYLRRPNPPWAWPLLLATVSAIHGYLLVMVFAIWVASLASRLWRGELRPMPTLLEIALAAALITGVLWSTGIFMVGSVESWGFGLFRMNLLGPINPAFFQFIVPGVPVGRFEWEGVNYVGLGIFALTAAVLVTFRPASLGPLVGPRFLPLVLIAVGLAVFALSNRLAFGSIELFELPLPDRLEKFLTTFRSSGRMFWPLGYLLIFALLALLSRQLRSIPALVVACLALGLQLADLQLGIRALKVGPDRTGTTWRTMLTSSAWEALAPHYQRVRALPVENEGYNWRELSWFAVTHQLPTDAVYLGRIDPTALAKAQAAADASLREGSFDRGAIYGLDTRSARRVLPHLGPDDVLAPVDGLILFAPGGKPILEAAGIRLSPFVSVRY
ncbi:MAG: hypothetical protein JWQ89_3401 [Devosia sp.]|uniref:DUF6311 domain-containing protein n=1 Tax=Devosia sp. TaxID=1871048 RepID=UPI00262E2AEA|nr:DUF6311 domain-containing protein [Devosia sp.]MDB5541674.1 hypothetical protein [Devosia sp.]